MDVANTASGLPIDASTLQAYIRSGDIVVRVGFGADAELAAAADGEWSHIGIVELEGEKAWVLHAAVEEAGNYGGKVLREPLGEFMRRSRRIGIHRPDPAIANDVMRAGKTYIGRLFDNDYQLTESERIYCSELVLRAFADAGHPLPIKLVHWSLPFLGEIEVALPGALAASSGQLIGIW